MKLRVTTKGEVNIIRIEGAIKSGNEYELAEKIECFVELIEEDQQVPGLYGASMAAVELLNNVTKGLSSENAYDVASYAYQAVFEVEILANLEEVMTESETAKLEIINKRCLLIITQQLQAVKREKKE